MKVSESKSARVHTAITNGKITWKVNYKNESIWCNTEQDLIKVIKQIGIVQLHGETFKTWTVGKGGWQLNSKVSDD